MISSKLFNFCKLIAILLALFIIYRVSTNYITNTITQNDTTKINKNTIEHFAGINYSNYGNVLSLKDTTNLPVYSNNQAIYELDNVYRIDTLVFMFNTEASTSTAPIYNKETMPLYIQYMDGGGNMRYLKPKTSTITTSPPNLAALVTNSIIKISDIIDENSLTIYTSKIIVIVGDSTNKIMNYSNASGNGYIKEYCIYGGDRSLFLKSDYDILNNNLKNVYTTTAVLKDGPTSDIKEITFNKIYSGNNMKIYSIQLTIAQSTLATAAAPSSKPFYITVKYNNSLYPANTFTINKEYIIRNDINKLSSTATTAFIFLNESIIANNLIFEVKNEATYTLSISGITVNGIDPTATDITDFKRTVNVSLSNNNIEGDINLCPNIDNLIEKQTKAQQICDNLEYQDKIKSEKLRLERNKQYLIKLKNQQEQIDDLNKVIQDLENKRQARANIADQTRVLQYQKQKGDASTIRDLANQRIESQDRNKLFMDLNINTTE